MSELVLRAVVLASESAESGSAHAYEIGGATLLIFVALIAALLAFGKGREHS